MRTQFDVSCFLPFLALVADRGDLFRLVEQIEGLFRFLFRDKPGPITTKAGEYLTPNLAAVFREVEEKGLEPKEDDKQSDFLYALIDFLKKVPQVKMTLAFEPSISFVDRLNLAITKAAGKKIILDIKVDPRIVAGALFEYQGKYFDGSMQKPIEAFVERKRSSEKGAGEALYAAK